MSKYSKHTSRLKNRRNAARARRTLITWLAVLGAGTAVGVLVIGLALSSDQGSTFTPQVSGAPRIEVAQPVVDHGTMRYEQYVESVFKVRNVGDQPLLLIDMPRVEVVEGCCPPRADVGTPVLKPGQETTVSLRYTMHEGMGGKHQFRIHLRTNDPAEPNTVLVAYSNWVP